MDLAFAAAGALLGDRTPFCTGTLIAPTLVLTAAHCVDSFAQQPERKIEFRVDVPIGQLRSKPVYAEVDKLKTKNHPEWSGLQGVRMIANDISVIVLKAPIYDVPPMPYNTNAPDEEWVGKKALFMGYGTTNPIQGQPSPVKNATWLTIVGIDPIDPRTNQPKEHTVSYEGKNTSVCRGDSGGPAFLQIDGRFMLIGVTSHGSDPRCRGESFSYRTDPYTEWIGTFFQSQPPCQEAKDCGPCATCTNGVCNNTTVQVGLSQCEVCKTNDDCSNGGTCLDLGKGLRCVYSCENGCCGTGFLCSNWGSKKRLCLPNDLSCPPISCQSSKECSSKEECIEGVCNRRKPKQKKDTCGPCQTKNDCANGSLCHKLMQPLSGQCFQRCEDGLCPEGFRCENPEKEAICIPSNDACPLLCEQENCPNEYICQSGICEPQGLERGMICGEKSPCKEGLQCLLNEDKGLSYCLLGCGASKGSAGSECKEGGLCNEGLQCMNNPMGGANICIEGCQQGSECKQGGQCFGAVNVCVCQSDSQCDGGVCRQMFSGIGVCMPKDESTCPNNESCLSLGNQLVCLPSPKPSQRLGETCSNLSTCVEGLSCAPFLNVCVEDCSSSNICKYGGGCRDIPNLGKLCLCDEQGAKCLDGYQCQIMQQGVGFCRSEEQGCSSNEECPEGTVCEEKRCVEETASLPETEEQSEDVGSSEIPDPETQADQDTKTNEQNNTKTPSSGCQCETKGQSSQPSFSFLFLGAFLLFFIGRRKNAKTIFFE